MVTASVALRPAGAQRPAAPEAPLRPTVGLTAVVAAHPIALATLGVEGDAGLATRLGLTAAGGITGRGGGRAVGEVAATGRFLLDPLRQAARGLYATGALALRLERGERPRPLVFAGVGIEGRPVGGVLPAVEAGVGGGVRLGVVLRPVRRGRR